MDTNEGPGLNPFLGFSPGPLQQEKIRQLLIDLKLANFQASTGRAKFHGSKLNQRERKIQK